MPRFHKGSGPAASSRRAASSDDLVQIYTELHPANPLPDVTGAKAELLAKELAAHIRAGIEPEEVVDLWKVFPGGTECLLRRGRRRLAAQRETAKSRGAVNRSRIGAVDASYALKYFKMTSPGRKRFAARQKL